MTTTQQSKVAVIIGAGPAGLTAAYELVTRTKVRPIILEKTDYMGGISRTVNYKNNRIDIGGHRFFSKSDRVMDWWINIMPVEDHPDSAHMLAYQGATREFTKSRSGVNAAKHDNVMLIRNRRSRLYFLRKLFDYPISLSPDTLTKLGLMRSFKIGCSYMKSSALPIKPERNLEQFFVNRFGKELYMTFFKSYTEKVWGVPCQKISADWGAQRIKGLSIRRVLSHAMKKAIGTKTPKGDIRQKGTETSLIERFLYPKLGPGQMWENVAGQVTEKGAQIKIEQDVVKISIENNRVVSIDVQDTKTGTVNTIYGDYFFSTMPVQELIRKVNISVPANVKEVSEGLQYRDFITVGLLVTGLKLKDSGEKLITDNWIYIQEPDVQLGRLQIFNNWSPYMVADPKNVWLGLEYFCNETDDLWKKSDADMIKLGSEELAKIGIIESHTILDATVIRMPKTYPGYFGTYTRFDEIRTWVDQFENLFLIGRNGMHKYNNQDHSMLTAMVSVDNIIEGVVSKDNLWAVNTETEYHEEK